MKKTIRLVLFLCVTVIVCSSQSRSDWPIFKGNIYFTGNNDELIVKEGTLKWLYQSKNTVMHPVVSDGRVYFADSGKIIHCLDEDTGRLLWSVNVASLMPGRRVGVMRYPLIVGNLLLIHDGAALYCLDRLTGKAVWARMGNIDTPGKKYSTDGIYAEPIIHDGSVVYGTRNVFMSRDVKQGRVRWVNDTIKTYSGFPSFYDKYVFTQSMDYGSDKYSVVCLKGDSGEIVWTREFPAPHRIFSPVVQAGKVYLPVNEVMHCLEADGGKEIWEKSYNALITSNPSFTESSILFTTGNRYVIASDIETGDVGKIIDCGEQSSPYFVTVRDQIYVSKQITKESGGADHSYTETDAYLLNREGAIWSFSAPFPGGPLQPAASRGLLFIPAGRVLYAIGKPYPKEKSEERVPANGDFGPEADTIEKSGADDTEKVPERSDPIAPMRDISVKVTDRGGKEVVTEIEVNQWADSRRIYSNTHDLSGSGRMIKVPEGDGVGLTVYSEGYVPRTIILGKQDRNAEIRLEPIQRGKNYILDNILFEIDEAYLTSESVPILNRLLEMLRNNPGMRIEIRGYTDSSGPRDHNIILSRRRAEAVRDYLVKNGVSPIRLAAVGFGPDNPIAGNDTIEGRRRNRRTEMVVVAQ